MQPNKPSFKDFIKLKKTQTKQIKNNSSQIQLITSFIDSQQFQLFLNSFQQLKNEQIVYYIFSQDSLKMTPLIKILSCKDVDKWLEFIFEQIKKSWEAVNQKICKQWFKNELIEKDWRNKLILLNKGVIKIILGHPEKDRQLLSGVIVKEFSKQSNFLSELYRNHFCLQFVKQHFALNLKVNENMRELASLLRLFYIPLQQKLWPAGETSLLKQLVDMKNTLVKDNIWNTGNFIQAIKNNEINDYTFQLEEMGLNFMHQLAINRDLKSMIQAHNLLQTSQNPRYSSLLSRSFNSFNTSQQTPIDIALLTWNFTEIQNLTGFIKEKPKTVRFSTNSLNLILQNPSLNKEEKQYFIEQILSPTSNHRGYVQCIIQETRQIKQQSQQNEHIQRFLTSNRFISAFVYDKNKRILKRYNNSYPLLSYLSHFKEKCNVKILQQLFLKDFFNKDSLKLKILQTIQYFWKSESNCIKKYTQEYSQVSQIIFYLMPLLKLLPKIKISDSTSFLLNQIFFNSPEIYFTQRSNGKIQLGIKRHFLVSYIENSADLSQNSQNKFILKNVFQSEEDEKFIGEKYNLYVDILKYMNSIKFLSNQKNQTYMVQQIRCYLRQYFDSVPIQQIFESDYFTELSWPFFQIKMKKKTIKNEEYSADKDWGLYKIDQICDRLKSVKLEKYIETKKKKESKNEKKKESETKINKLSVVADILVKYLIKKKQQADQTIYPEFDEEKILYFKNRYENYRTHYSLSKYVQKLQYEKQKEKGQIEEIPKIQLSLTQAELEGKINLLLNESIDFYFCEVHDSKQENFQSQVKNLQKQNQKLLHGGNIEELKDLKLKSIVKRMADKGLSFMMALIYCEQGQYDGMEFILSREENQQFSQRIADYVVSQCRWDSKYVERKSQNQKQGKIIPIEILFKIQQFLNSKPTSNFKDLSNKTILAYLLKSMESKLNSLQHITQNQRNKLNIEKQMKFEQFLQYWQKNHTFIKRKFEYKENINSLIKQIETKIKQALFQGVQQQQVQQQQQQQDEQQDKQQFDDLRISQKDEQFEQLKQPQENTKQQQQAQENTKQQPLNDYYLMLASKLLLKYHKQRADLSFIIEKLQVEQIFLMDGLFYLSFRYLYGFSNSLLVYRMQLSQRPFDILIKRLQIMNKHLIPRSQINKNYLLNKNQVFNVFLKQFERFTFDQFVRILEILRQELNLKFWRKIFKVIKDQQKLIYLLDRVLQSTKKQIKNKFTPTYLLSLVNYNHPQFSILILLIVDLEVFKFAINENIGIQTQNKIKGIQTQNKILVTDNIRFYHQCQLQTFIKLIEPIKKYYCKNSNFVSQKLIETKIQKMMRSLVAAQAWDRIEVLLNIKNFDNMEIFLKHTFRYIGQHLFVNKSKNQTQQQQMISVRIIQKLFALYKQLQLPFIEDIFRWAFLRNPRKAFQIMKPVKLRVQTFVVCLKEYPQQAVRFLKNNIEVDITEQPNNQYFKHNFPLITYKSQEFDSKPWMIDLLRLQKKILQSFNKLNLLDKTMKNLILSQQMENYFEEFYSKEDIQLKCSKLLSSNKLISIKKYPKAWFDQYFAKNDIKNVTILAEQLLLELIDMGYLKRYHIFKIIMTCKMDVVKYFCEKHKIQFNLKTIDQLQDKYLDKRYKNSIWQFLSKIQNQKFVIKFIKFFNLFKVCPVQSYDEILLTNIAVYKRIELLKLLLEHCQQVSTQKLEFVFNKKGKMRNYLVTFPEQIAVQMNFYQYYFLVKQSKNQCPIFYTSTRFLINGDNYKQQIQIYDFIPEMKRCMELYFILGDLKDFTHDRIKKSKLLLKYLFKLQYDSQQQNQDKIQDNFHQSVTQQVNQKQKLSIEQQLSQFITYLNDQNPKIFLQQNIGSYCSILALYLNWQKIGISIDQLQKLYPKQILIFKKVDKFLKKDSNVFNLAFNIIKRNPKIKGEIFVKNFNFFMENFKNQLDLIESFDDTFIYLKGMLANLKTFQTVIEYKQYLIRFLDLCFSTRNKSHQKANNHISLIKPYILKFMLVSYCEGTGFTFKFLCRILEIQKQGDGKIFYRAALGINEISLINKKQKQPLFDIRTWNSVINQIESLNKEQYEENNNVNINRLVKQSVLSLEQELQTRLNIKISNLQNIILDSVQKIQVKKGKSNISKLLTILVNETYILSECFELHHQLKDMQKSMGLKAKNKGSKSIQQQQKHGKITITFESQKFTIQISEQNHQIINLILPYSWINVQSDLPLMHFNVQHSVTQVQKYTLLQNLSLDPSIHMLNKIFSNQANSSFKNINFKFNVDSLRKLQKTQSLKKVIAYFPMTENGVSEIQRTLKELDEKVFHDKTISYYSFSDVYGPVNISNGQNHQKVVDCLSFYQLLELPSKEVIIEVVDKKPTQKQMNQRILNDFLEYIKYVQNQVKDVHPSGMENFYKFLSKIQLFIDEQTLKVSVFTHQFSLFNILKGICRINAASDERRRAFFGKVDLRYDFLSVINIFQKQSTVYGKDFSILQFIFLFLRNKWTANLINEILVLIIEDAIDFMRVLKGVLVSFTIDKKNSPNKQRKRYFLTEHICVNEVDYKVQQHILRIFIDVNLMEQKHKQFKFIEVEESKLVSRTQFLESIFQTTEFLTNYFLHKEALDTECIKISRQLSQKLNVHLNLHINYKSLYGFIERIKNQIPIKDIDGYLRSLRIYILLNLKKKVYEYFTSPLIHQSHQALLINKFQALYEKLTDISDQKINMHQIQQKVSSLQNSNCLDYQFSSQNEQTPLRYIEEYGKNVQNFNSQGCNKYLIQVYKNYFSTLVNEGSAFIIGYKQSKRSPQFIKFIKREDINRVNINHVSYILLVSQTVPSNDELEHKKIIRIFVTDMYKNIYQISDSIKNYLLELKQEEEQLKNINNLIPIIPRNVCIDFESANNLISENLKISQTSGMKVFNILLPKQPHFQIKPTQQKRIKLCNYLRKDMQMNKSIRMFLTYIHNEWKSKQLRISIEQSGVSLLSFRKISEIIRNSLSDLQSAFAIYLQNTSTNSELDCYLSINHPSKANIKDNSIIMNRISTFLRFFKRIKFILTDSSQSNLKIQKDEIHFDISSKAEQYLDSKFILHKILIAILSRMISQSNFKIVMESHQIADMSIIQLIKCIDILNLTVYQAEQIQRALTLHDKIFERKSDEIKITYHLKKGKISYIKQKQKQDSKEICVNFNIDSIECQFFTVSQILMLKMNGFNKRIQNYTFNTYYDSGNSTINVYGMIKNQYTLIVQEQNLNVSKAKIDMLNNRKGLIEINQNLKKSLKKPIRYYIIDIQGNQAHENYIYQIIPQKDEKVITKKQNSININQTINLYVKQTKQNSIFELKMLPIYQNLKKKNDLRYLTVQMISRQVARLSFCFDRVMNLLINLDGYQNVFDELNKTNLYQITVSSSLQAIIQNTKFVQLYFRNKTIQSPQLKSKQQNIQKQKLFFQPPQKYHHFEQKSINQSHQNKNDDVQNLIYVVNNESRKYLTRAGQKRIDYIEICDANFNPIQYKGEINLYFKQVNNLCLIRPEIVRKGLRIGLFWTPTIRGHYKVYFNGICLNPEYEIGVCASVVDPSYSTIQIPKIKKICYYQQNEFTLNLKDQYKNIYTQLQENILGDKLIIQIQAENQKIKKSIKKKQQMINKYGTKKIKFWIQCLSQIDPTKSIIKVFINKQKINQFELQIQGASLSQRRKSLQKQLDHLNKNYCKDIIVSRYKFLESLFKIAQKSLLTNFSVKFEYESGIDAGGLKRQFYDMIGNEIKSQNNAFFKLIDSKKLFYFINPLILRNKKKSEYMQLLGKYLANSILNGYLIGVNFSPVFVKLLYQDQIQFQDLLQVLPEDESRMYKYLTTAQPDEFQDLEIYFSVIVDKKKGIQLELKQNGGNIQVLKENVSEYLNLLTKVLIKDRYDQVIEAFRNGFESVIPLKILIKWIKPHQLWCLTQGTKQINAEIVLNYINFRQVSDLSLVSWFRRYINEASIEVLEGFLKFASGSSSIDYDQNSKITVTFQNTGQNSKRLPISHTCWKEIVVPKYKSYEIMHKLLDAAFIFCSEGFGFG